MWQADTYSNLNVFERKSMQHFKIYTMAASETSTLFVQHVSKKQVRRDKGKREEKVSIRILFVFL